jgi:hypothetical protein
MHLLQAKQCVARVHVGVVKEKQTTRDEKKKEQNSRDVSKKEGDDRIITTKSDKHSQVLI